MGHRESVDPLEVDVVQLRDRTPQVRVERTVVGQVLVVRVAGEELVRALTGQHHLDVLGREAGGEVRGNGAADQVEVERLERVHDLREVFEDLDRVEHVLVVHGAEVLRHEPGRQQVGASRQADRERVQHVHVLAHERRDGAAVEAAGQEGPHGNVRDEPAPHSEVERFTHGGHVV